MSRENVELLRCINVALNRGNRDALLDAFHPDIEWRDLRHGPDAPELVSGVAAVRTIIQQWDEAFDEFGAEVSEYIDAGRWVICDSRWYGKGRGGEVSIDLRQADAYELEDGRIVRAILGYPDTAAALEAVGRRD
jgi:ketosteroid isomerase-like protein